MKFLTFNSIVLLITLASLLYRKGSFSTSLTLKPFELLILFLSITTALYIVWNHQVVSFFKTIPKNIWIALTALVVSVCLGWGIGVYIHGNPTSLNMVLEFGTFAIGVVVFVLVYFYSNSSAVYKKWLLYALLIPVIYIPCMLFQKSIPSSMLASDGNFIGFTLNVNTLSKILLIPTVFFVVQSIFPAKKVWHKLLYISVATTLVTMLFWIASRGSLFSLGMGLVVMVVLTMLWNRKMVLPTILTVVVIVVFGFLATPYERKQVSVNRIINSDSEQLSISEVKGKNLFQIVKESREKKYEVHDEKIIEKQYAPETRLQIWPFYLTHLILPNPLGIGPNTHIPSPVVNINNEHVSSGPHNTYLQIWLWGGIIGLISFLYVLGSAFLNLKLQLSRNFNAMTLSLLVILFVLAVVIAFDDSLSFYWYWIIVALSLTHETTD